MYDIELEGAEELIKKIEELEGYSGETITKALKSGAEIVKEAAKSEAPIDTRNLVDNIAVSRIKRGARGTRYVWIGDVNDKAKYSWILEYGSWKLIPLAWLSRSYDKCKKSVVEAMKEEFKKGMKL